jgi:hypothetical protein
METEYHCAKCNSSFSEEGLPNINKVHRACGSLARILRHAEKEEEEE